MLRPAILGLIGIGLALSIFATASQQLPGRGPISLVGFGLVLGGLLWAAAEAWQRRRPRDPYSLEALRRLDQEETFRRAEEFAIESDASEIICPHCGENFDRKYPVCPRCRR